jgi:hypothetical protein
VTVIDQAIRALARHYRVTEAEITEDLVVMVEWDGESIPLENVTLEAVTHSLIAALGALNAFGFDDDAVTAAEEIAAEFDLP